MTTYQLRKLGHMLKSGEAWIMGRITTSDHWPMEPHYWIIYDNNQNTYHVLCDDRPRWSKYNILYKRK